MVQAEYIFDEAEFFLHHYFPRYKLNEINWIYVFKRHFMYILKNKTFISKVIKTDSSEDKTHNGGRLVIIFIHASLLSHPLMTFRNK